MLADLDSSGCLHFTISHEHSAENLRSREVTLLAQGHSFWKHWSSDPHFLDSGTCVHLALATGLDSAFRMSRVLRGGSLGWWSQALEVSVFWYCWILIVKGERQNILKSVR